MNIIPPRGGHDCHALQFDAVNRRAALAVELRRRGGDSFEHVVAFDEFAERGVLPAG